MKHLCFLLLCCGYLLIGISQQPSPPDKIYGELFRDVQMAKIFPDGKTFVDCVPKKDPAGIVADYKKIKSNPAIRFSLELFVNENFVLPINPATNYQTNTQEDLVTHIRNLWKVLKREADQPMKGSSLLPLPYSYIVPGGRFREIYYWDSYFTMLGLQESGEYEIMENMIKNFAYLIKTFGHIPNGNRSYYLGRSQPPFFSLMVGLLAEVKGDSIYKTYLPAMEKEYKYWMEGAATLKPGQAHRRIVKLKDGTILNRYWDDSDVPRQESYAQDVETTVKSGRNKIEMYRHLRAGAESGWDFSSRWFKDAKNIITVQTTDIIPVDLNCLLYGLEINLAKARSLNKDEVLSNELFRKAASRKNAILKYGWNKTLNFFTDFNFRTNITDTIITAAGLYPLFMKLATADQANKVLLITKSRLLKDGGIVTTNNMTGEQWDSPNGWAPLQWVTIKGFENYNFKEAARDIATRWVAINEKVFKSTGRMMEKYNVLDTHLEAGGGEYPGQDGFGWTNGVYLKLVSMYVGKEEKEKEKVSVRTLAR
ncbi:MAG: alpha,alpha-trehalase TreA [Chitinophagaceae bacterium]